MTKCLPLMLLCLLVAPAAADDPAQANRLLVEAVQLMKAADAETGASGKLALLEDAIARLDEIIEQHPSSSLAVKLITDQPIGSLSLPELRERAAGLRIEIAQQHGAKERADGGRRFAAVSHNTNFLLQIDLDHLVGTPFGRKFLEVYRRHLETHADPTSKRAADFLFRHFENVDRVIVAADISHVGEEDEVERLAGEFVMQFTSDTGFDIAAMAEELKALRPGSEELRVMPVFSREGYAGYIFSTADGRLYVFQTADAAVWFAGLRLAPLAAAMRRHASGSLVDVENLLKVGSAGAHISVSASLPRALRERLSKQHRLDTIPNMPELPLDEIFGNVFEVGQVLIEAAAERHVRVDLGLGMDTAMSANIFYVLGNTLVLPAMKLLDEGLFVSDPVLKLDDLNLAWKFEFDGDELLNRFEKSLPQGESASEPGGPPQ
ncbi:MAG: hypothetical protein OXP66_18300 [Candidatus Tectomicrobia bacterium]|nr:hypothetical protein [Candidatus Tectomicrobia bacterium]